MPADINTLLPERGLIQLTSNSHVDFDADNYKLNRLHGDVMLCEYIDVSEDGESIKRHGGLFIPINAQTKAWRKAKIILVGTDIKYSAVGEIVMFPHNYGVEIRNIEVAGHGKVEHGVFINEARIFGACELIN